MFYVLFVWVFAAVVGWPEFNPEYWYLAFFSEGFKIWEEEKWKSMSCACKERRERAEQRGEGQELGKEGTRGWDGGKGSPERNRTVAHPLTSYLLRCHSHRNNWVPKTMWPAASLQRTRIHPPPPDHSQNTTQLYMTLYRHRLHMEQAPCHNSGLYM